MPYIAGMLCQMDAFGTPDLIVLGVMFLQTYDTQLFLFL